MLSEGPNEAPQLAPRGSRPWAHRPRPERLQAPRPGLAWGSAWGIYAGSFAASLRIHGIEAGCSRT